MSATAKSYVNRDEKVAALAHSFWEQDGRPEGRSEEHWLRAAVLVDQEGSKPVTVKKPAAKKPRKVS